MILLVEDDAEHVALAFRALGNGKVNHRIEVARDGAEALDFVFCQGAHAERKIEDGPSVVLLDLVLPKVDGLEVLRRIKGDARTRSIPVVVLTSSEEQRDVLQGYPLGTSSYLVKPLSLERFAAALQQLGLYWPLLNDTPVDIG